MKNIGMFKETSPERIEYLKSRIEKFESSSQYLGKVLNDIHQTSFDDRFWHLILLNYVNTVQQKFDSYSSEYNKTKSLRPSLSNYILILLKQSANFYKKLVTIGGASKIYSTLETNDHVTLGFFDRKIANGEIGPEIPQFRPLLPTKGDNRKRERLQILVTPFNSDKENFLLTHLPYNIVEGFSNWYDNVKLIEPAKKIFHISVIDSLYMQLFIAKYVHHGAQLYYYQHGGVCGENQYHHGHSKQSAVADKFITFGWRINEKDEPLGATHRFNSFRESYLVNRTVKHDILIGFPKIKPINVQVYEGMTKELLEHLDRKTYPVLVARPHPTQRWKNDKKQLKFLNKKNIIVDKARSRENISALVGGSRIVVMLMHPTTNFLECVFVDHPIIAVLTNDNPSEIVRPYYQFFIEKKVFHPDMYSMVQFLNCVEIGTWWAEIINHPVYKDFKWHFARDTQKVQ